MTNEQLVLDNMRLAYHVANKFRNISIEYEDIVQTALLGLIQAADTYKPDNKIAFSTYACVCMRNEILVSMRTKHHKLQVISLETPVDERHTLADVIPDTEPQPDERVEGEDEIQHLYKHIERMPSI